jgi:F0F1-type ATP synthase membrane subunit b/b'
MSDNPNPNENQSHPVDESWQEVGRQFESLGTSLVQAFRAAWSSVETNADAQKVKSGLESMAREVGQAIEDTARTPEAQKIKEEAKRTAESLRVAGEQTVQEARPQIISALRKANEELQRLIEGLEIK